uniref:RSE1/DDB1/CPSF1 C-terminal domain-containing protein n=1 Tax=Salix viminalis TaxID=40686 RepID=A0A6N2L2D1_SALVM
MAYRSAYFPVKDVCDEIEGDLTGGKIQWEQGKLNGCPNKVEEIVQFHIEGISNSRQGGECIMYGTVMGSVGALLPFTSRDDDDFFSHLEMHLRHDHQPLSAYFPVKDVIGGDLCEQFPTLPLDAQRKNADELDRTPGKILKKT